MNIIIIYSYNYEFIQDMNKEVLYFLICTKNLPNRRIGTIQIFIIIKIIIMIVILVIYTRNGMGHKLKHRKIKCSNGISKKFRRIIRVDENRLD